MLLSNRLRCAGCLTRRDRLVLPTQAEAQEVHCSWYEHINHKMWYSHSSLWLALSTQQEAIPWTECCWKWCHGLGWMWHTYSDGRCRDVWHLRQHRQMHLEQPGSKGRCSEPAHLPRMLLETELRSSAFMETHWGSASYFPAWWRDAPVALLGLSARGNLTLCHIKPSSAEVSRHGNCEHQRGSVLFLTKVQWGRGWVPRLTLCFPRC